MVDTSAAHLGQERASASPGGRRIAHPHGDQLLDARPPACLVLQHLHRRQKWWRKRIALVKMGFRLLPRASDAPPKTTAAIESWASIQAPLGELLEQRAVEPRAAR